MMALILCKIQCFWDHLVTKGKSFIFPWEIFGLLFNRYYSAPTPSNQAAETLLYRCPQNFWMKFFEFLNKILEFLNKSTTSSDSFLEPTYFSSTTWVEGSAIWKGPYGSRMGPLWREREIRDQSPWEQSMVRNMTPKPNYSPTKAERVTVWYSGKAPCDIQAICFTLAKWSSFSGPEFPNLWN